MGFTPRFLSLQQYGQFIWKGTKLKWQITEQFQSEYPSQRQEKYNVK